MVRNYDEIVGALKGRARAPVFELIGQTGIALTQWCRLFDPLFPLNSIAVASFLKISIGSTLALRWRNTVIYLRRSRAGCRAPAIELVGQTGIPQWRRLFDPLFSLHSIAVASFLKIWIGSTSALCICDVQGPLPLNWSVKLVLPVPSAAGFLIHCSH
jgi:hypothetical protein